MTKRIIAVIGDYYHPENWIKQSLDLVMEQLNDVTMEFVSVTSLVASLQSKPDAVILFAENRLNPADPHTNTWMDDDTSKVISDYVKDGGAWFAWHSGLASYENIEEYTYLLKGYFKYHPTEHQVVTYYTDEDNWFIEKKEPFEILDEHYFVHCDEHHTNVFLRSKSVDGDSIAGWHHPYGNGHVVCLTPAHRKEGLGNTRLVALVAKSIKLCCG